MKNVWQQCERLAEILEISKHDVHRYLYSYIKDLNLLETDLSEEQIKQIKESQAWNFMKKMKGEERKEEKTIRKYN